MWEIGAVEGQVARFWQGDRFARAQVIERYVFESIICQVADDMGFDQLDFCLKNAYCNGDVTCNGSHIYDLDFIGALKMKTLYSLFIPAELFPRKREAVKVYRELCDEFKYRVQNQIAGVANEGRRLLYEGLPPCSQVQIMDAMESFIESLGVAPVAA